MPKIESEYLILLVCPLYTELRRKYLYTLFLSLAKFIFDQLMMSKSKKIILSIAKFISSTQELRKSALNP